MPTYTTVTLGQLVGQVSTLLDDPGAVYWTEPEITLAIQEGLRVWGALTSYWRTRGTWAISPNPSSPWNDLSVLLPALRTRSWTLGTMVRDIQYMCLEAANGITGAGMSGQITITSILQSIQRGRNRFVLDAHLPLSVHQVFSGPPPPVGMIQFPQTSVFVHRASWMDIPGGAWTNLWREDAWSEDKNSPEWTIEPGSPRTYSEAENSPLQLQLVPPPSNSGAVEALTVDSLTLDLTDPSSTFDIPDEWIHAVKYAALSDMFSAESQNKDPLRAQYAEARYQQAITFAKDARSILRLLINGVPLPIDSMAALDAGVPFWRNQPGKPNVAGVLYDLVAFAPALPNATYGIAADVVQSAPIPVLGSDFIPLGPEDINNLIDYVTHMLTFKCGGKEFTGTLPQYDGFLAQATSRKGINAAKIRYLTPLFGQPQAEWDARPDRLEVGA